MRLEKAQKKKVKLKIGVSGASGFGKTYSALLIANGICGDWSKIAVIDSENGSASLYSDLGEYNTINLQPPYSPERYIEAITLCENSGIEVIIVDSVSHEWEGVGGCLEIYEKLGGAYRDWAKVTPRHKRFINKILQTQCHFITTTRRKQDYEQTKGDNGRWKVQKVGTKEVTREGFEYELTVNFEITNELHLAKASKDRTSLFADVPEFVITSETGKSLMNWANDGVDEKEYLKNSIKNSKNREELVSIWNNYKQYQKDKEIEEIMKTKSLEFKQIK